MSVDDTEITCEDCDGDELVEEFPSIFRFRRLGVRMGITLGLAL